MKADGPVRSSTSLKSEAAPPQDRAVRFGKPPSPAGRQVAAIDGSPRRGDYSCTKAAAMLIPGLQESMTAAWKILALLVNPRYPSDPEGPGRGGAAGWGEPE